MATARPAKYARYSRSVKLARHFNLVPEMAAPGEHHRHTVLIGGGDHFRILHRTARLHHSGRAGLSHGIKSVAEREEGVRRGHRTREDRGGAALPTVCLVDGHL